MSGTYDAQRDPLEGLGDRVRMHLTVMGVGEEVVGRFSTDGLALGTLPCALRGEDANRRRVEVDPTPRVAGLVP